MPQELKDRLEKSASENRRSITAELVARLENSFETECTALNSTDKDDKILRELAEIKRNFIELKEQLGKH